MFPLNNKYIWPLCGALILALGACAPKQLEPTYTTPPPEIQVEDNRLYIKALNAQKAGRYADAMDLWKVYLKRHPDSFRGHNNLGRVYYMEDKLGQAVQEFETALKLAPADPRIQQNLAEALRLQASLLYEDKKYDETIQRLVRLRDISNKKDKQGVQIRIEKVEDKIFEQVRGTDTLEGYREFVERYPDGLNADRARQRLKEMETHSMKTVPQPEVETVLPKTPFPVKKEGMETQSSLTQPKTKVPVLTEEYLKEKEKYPAPVSEDKVDIIEAPLVDDTAGKGEGKFKPKTKITPFNKEAELYNTEKFGEEGSKEPVEVIVALPEPNLTPTEKVAPVVVEPTKQETPPQSMQKEPVVGENTDALLESLEKDIMEVLQPETQVPSEQMNPVEEMKVETGETPVMTESMPKTGDPLVEPMEMAQAPIQPKPGPKKETATKPPKKKLSDSQKPVTKKTQPEQLAKLPPQKQTPPEVKKKEPVVILVEVTIKSGKLNVRSIPSTQTGKIIGKLDDGKKVRLLKETADWFKVEFAKNKEGWIHRGFSKKLPPAPRTGDEVS